MTNQELINKVTDVLVNMYADTQYTITDIVIDPYTHKGIVGITFMLDTISYKVCIDSDACYTMSDVLLNNMLNIYTNFSMYTYTYNTSNPTYTYPTVKTTDHINPSHYKGHPSGVECITITRHMNFNVGSAVKYLWRQGLKDNNPSVQDLKKAIWYIQDEIDKLEKE